MSELSGAYLQQFLRPFTGWLADPDVSEIALNEPGEVWLERRGHVGMQREVLSCFQARDLEQLARQVAAASNQAVNQETPLLSASLPGGERIQFVLPPVSRAGAFSIRRQVVQNLSLADYEAIGAFTGVVVDATEGPTEVDRRLRGLLQTGALGAFLREAVRSRRNVVISGGTSTGKTTFLNALAKEIPAHERLLTIEDTRELCLSQGNTLSLVASKGDQGDARVTIQDLLEAALRMRPDRILLGELRGKEAYTFLRAINTGHPGSLSTLHADSPARAYEQLALMVLQAGLGLQRAEIISYVRSVVDVVIQLHRTEDGRRVVSEVVFARA